MGIYAACTVNNTKSQTSFYSSGNTSLCIDLISDHLPHFYNAKVLASAMGGYFY